jgi:predicted secreted protein
MFETLVLAAVIAGLYFMIKAIWDYELKEVE